MILLIRDDGLLIHVHVYAVNNKTDIYIYADADIPEIHVHLIDYEAC